MTSLTNQLLRSQAFITRSFIQITALTSHTGRQKYRYSISYYWHFWCCTKAHNEYYYLSALEYWLTYKGIFLEIFLVHMHAKWC